MLKSNKLLPYVCFVFVYYALRALFVLRLGGANYMTVLDVGQGDSIVINIPTYGQVLVDTGSDYQSNYLYARDYLFPVCQIKTILVTHYDQDHSGGLDRTMKYCKNAILYDTLYTGDTLRTGNVLFYVLSPGKGVSRREENDDSLVLLYKADEFEALLSGDAGVRVMEKAADLLDSYRKDGYIGPVLDVYKVPHHGSRHNSSPELIKRLNPLACVISVGRNSYGHPDPQVLNDLAAGGCRIYRTDDLGSILFSNIYPM